MPFLATQMMTQNTTSAVWLKHLHVTLSMSVIVGTDLNQSPIFSWERKSE